MSCDQSTNKNDIYVCTNLQLYNRINPDKILDMYQK